MKTSQKPYSAYIAFLALLCLFGLQSTALFAADAAANKPERTPLWGDQAPIGDGKFDSSNAFVTIYHPAKPTGAAVVICPGGGYGFLSLVHEGQSIAKWLNSHGITGIVLEYRLPKFNRFLPLLDAQRALRMVRNNAAAWHCDPKRIGIIGFSAGGHLASTAATHFDDGIPTDPDPVNRLSSRPDFAILIYPVITMGPKTHGGSRYNLLGRNTDAKTIELYSNEKQVTAKTPPTFLAHAKDDTLVVPENSQMFFAALQACKVPSKYLELPSGGHGLNNFKGPSWDAWQTQSLEWLTSLKIIPAP